MGQVIDFQRARNEKKANDVFFEYAAVVSKLTNGLDDRMVSALPWTGLIETIGRLMEYREPYFLTSELTYRIFDEEIHLKCSNKDTQQEYWLITARYEVDAEPAPDNAASTFQDWVRMTRDLVSTPLQSLKAYTVLFFVNQLYRSNILPCDLFETPTKARMTLKGRGYTVDVFVAK